MEFNHYNNFIKKLKNDIKTQQTAVNRATQKAEIKKEEVIKAMAERKSYEKLKEKEYEKYLIDIKLKEQQTVDELVSFKHRS